MEGMIPTTSDPVTPESGCASPGPLKGFRVISKIGEGGMASVFKGFQISLSRPVAIKVLSTALENDDFLLERFQRESLIIARLAHPNIIHVIDRGLTRGGLPYFVMEYVEGMDLRAAIRTGKLGINRKLDLLIQICKALSYAHRNGVVHRDIKPSNVIIDREGNARVLDFGIAQFYGDLDGDTSRTRSGLILGTPPYMSPEQQAGGTVTALSDLYSLGALAYELLTGEKALGHFPPPSTVEPSIPRAVEEVILRCLQPDPANRPASADEMREVCLKQLGGAHLGSTQRERASQGISRIEDKFALLDVISEDRHGAVYLYQDKGDHGLLVIKKIPRTSAGLTEARLLTSLRHENIIRILGASRNERFFIVVMEYLGGGSLRDRLVRPLPLEDALRTAREICAALAFAHRNRIIHGNLRPTNVLFTESGTAKITDFGQEEASPDDAHKLYRFSSGPDSRSPLADIFAAGVLLYQMLTGFQPKWKGTHLLPNKEFQALPEEVQDLVSRMLSPRRGVPEGRIEPLISAFDALLGESDHTIELETSPSTAPAPSPHSPGRRILGLFILALVLGGAGGAAYLHHIGELSTVVQMLLDTWERTSLHLSGLLRP